MSHKVVQPESIQPNQVNDSHRVIENHQADESKGNIQEYIPSQHEPSEYEYVEEKYEEQSEEEEPP